MTEAFVANQLFKPFVSTKPDGFGIGAYEARALAISMGGSLRVESRLGKGSIFTLLLPAATQRGTNSHQQEAA
jgi:signal transduction histidine kinase